MRTKRPLDEIQSTLAAPDHFPAVIEDLVMGVEFTARAVDAGKVPAAIMNVEDTIGHMNVLMAAGFLGRSEQARGAAQLQATRSGRSCVRIELESAGVHRNVVPMLVRLIYHMHQTPPGAFARLVAAFDGDEQSAHAVYAGVEYAETVAEICLHEIRGSAAMEPLQLESSVADDGLARPVGWPEADYGEWERIIIDGFDSSAVLDDELEDAWLSLAMMQAFVPLGRPVGFEPGDEEFFFRDAEAGRQLVCDALAIELFWLSEWLMCLVGGSAQDLAGLIFIPDIM